ncbi:uncharacterized protein LOC142555018 [Primulina tabacum]|uniref:uncharacterized protein LOC142555018 n=1 Tax=Primulina tabacum TaxID=48773 RepID=UPI003F5A29F5
MRRPNRVLRQFGMSQNIPISALDGDHLHECSRRGRKNYDWVKHHRLMVDAWENRHNLIVESDLVENYSMRYDYETWYDSITRRFISPLEPQQIDYGYQAADAYFRRIVRDETSNLKNLFGGLSIDDQPREALAEVVKKTIQTCDLLYEMSFRTPEQQHHHARSSNRRRRLRDDDVADEPSFSTSDWRQSLSTQSPTTHSWPHSSHGTCFYYLTTLFKFTFMVLIQQYIYFTFNGLSFAWYDYTVARNSWLGFHFTWRGYFAWRFCISSSTSFLYPIMRIKSIFIYWFEKSSSVSTSFIMKFHRIEPFSYTWNV